MSEQRTTRSASIRFLLKAIAVLAVGALLTKWLAMERRPETPVAARPTSYKEKGEFGGDLSLLKSWYSGPRTDRESNHYLDLWSPGALRTLSEVQGLTNNNALFVDSHSRSGYGWNGTRHGFYPHQSLLRADEKIPAYSARDIATVLGPTNAAAIHNILLAGCNEASSLRPAEFRKYFVNATNITYMSPGKLAYKPMFYQAITERSAAIRPLYGKPLRASDETIKASISVTPSDGAEPLGHYIADLYLPGAKNPFRTQRAGRELLDPLANERQMSAANPQGLSKREF